MLLPEMVSVKQRFDVTSIEDVEAEASETVNRSGVLDGLNIVKGSSVAVGVGSRGIVNLCEVVRGVCRALEAAGAVPFVFPAMGSHGGGTARGQLDVLRSLGVSEETVNVEFRSDPVGVHIGETPDGIPLHADRNALNADHIVLINRVKPHTKFSGKVESGISKMLAVGLGKVNGAAQIHRNYAKFGFAHVIPTVVKHILPLIPFAFGVAIVESPYKTIHSLSILTADTIETEPELLKLAGGCMARIPVDEIDVLIIDQMGKDISGVGMDTNVISRKEDMDGKFSTNPLVKRIFIRDLTVKTEGNAHGIGLADFTTRRLVNKIDFQKTLKNALTAMNPQEATTPLTLKNDRDGFEASLQSLGLTDGSNARVVRITNTSELEHMQFSTALLESLSKEQAAKIEVTGQPGPIGFDQNGDFSD